MTSYFIEPICRKLVYAFPINLCVSILISSELSWTPSNQMLHHAVHYFFEEGLSAQIVWGGSMVPNIYQKLDFYSDVYFFEYEHLKRFVWKGDNILPIAEDWKSGTIFRACGDRCLL